MNTFQMPNVFVIPPEEDHSPAWCYFDATKRQFDLLDSALIPIDANISPTSKNAILYAINQPTNDCVENDINYDCEAELHFEQGLDFLDQSLQESHVPPWINYRELGDDSDVAEVIKIRHRVHVNEELEPIGHSEHTTEVTRPQTLKSRASKVFHSLKRVGKRKSIKLFRTRDNVTFPASLFFLSSHSVGASEKDSDPPRTSPKRSPILVSEIFTPTTGPISLPSFSHAEECIILSTSQSNLPLTTSEGPDTGISSSHEHVRMHDDRPIFPPRTVSPNPSFLNKPRFSKINIQKLFSFTNSTSSVCSVSSTISGGSTLSGDDNTVLAHSSTTVPAATKGKHSGFVHSRYDPTEPELGNVPIAYEMDYAVPSQSLASCKTGGKSADDDGFEMCLDSLCFDDLSFDVNTFRL